MTRFMMTIDGAVDLVLYAFQNGSPGDIFVQKAPAATIARLAEALLRDVRGGQRDSDYRHPPRREALRNAAEPGRDGARGEILAILSGPGRRTGPELFAVFSAKDETKVSEAGDYNSHNTELLNVEAMMRLLLKIDVRAGSHADTDGGRMIRGFSSSARAGISGQQPWRSLASARTARRSFDRGISEEELEPAAESR